ncbi:MAG: hypothetical protein NTX22_04880 [Ignavibacteriales bacterium]|nr:hypothetical protein [Ignavibacteriales bacterium]
MASYGQIYSTSEADTIYGTAILSVSITKIELTQFINATTDLLMFNIIDGDLFILGNGRKTLYPAGQVIGNDIVFRVFSVSKINELLNQGKSETVFIEKRNNDIISLTNGSVTLEFGVGCPPYCE